MSSTAYEGTLRWFGRPFDSPMYEGMPKTTLEYLYRPCLLCDELILDGEAGVTMPCLMGGGWQERPIHIECHVRSVMGPPAHLDGLCSCNSDQAETDPRYPTYRDEAHEVLRRLWGEG